MPSVSAKQKRFMDAAAHNPDFAKQVGVPMSVAKDFSESSKGMTFGKGASKSRDDIQSVNNPKTNHGGSALFSKGGSMAKMNPFEKSGKDVEPKGMKEGSKKEEAFDRKQMMGMKKMAGGGYTRAADGIAKKGKTQGAMIKMANGGFVRAADGIAQRGKTQATQIKMSKGGKAC